MAARGRTTCMPTTAYNATNARICLKAYRSKGSVLLPLASVFLTCKALGRKRKRKTHSRRKKMLRPVALTSHVMKTMERLLLNHLRPQVHHAEDPLQFAYREKVGVEDAILYLLHRTHSHLDKGGGAVRVMFFDFSSAFNTIQPLLLRDKLMKMEVDMHLVTWITDYLTGRPQHVRIRDCSSDTVISSTGAPQGTVLSPVLFTLYTSDFKYNSELCHMQKFSDDTAIVGCVRNGQEREYRSLVEDFVEWCTTNHLKLNITKTKEMCIDFRRSRPSQQPISIKGVDVEVVRSYRYLGVHLDERLDWSVNTDTVYKKAQSRLYFLRRLGSFRICQKLLLMFYQSVVASVLFYAVVCWGGSISKRDAGRLDRLVRKAGSVLGLELESLTPLAERRALSKLLNIMDNVHHPLHTTIIRQRSSFSGRLLSQSCSTDRLRKSFVNSSQNRAHEGGLRAQRPVVGPVLTGQHRTARLAFATEYQNWQIHHRRLVLFTDESRFYLSTCDRRDRLWRCRGECYAACDIIQHDWFGGSVMVWGGISLEGHTDLCRLDNGTLTAIRHLDEILGPLV
ncbi:hypothetical protein NFI96_009490 [Prochilodus magdalenae]|nr:hypothetical protein NFI96_009490 [Prochilodus magdalenae]